MAQYINKDALIAEIERRKEVNKYRDTNDSLFEDEAILSFINGIEMKEVDLEKEVKLWMESNEDDAGYFDTLEFAKHFFELGLKAKQTSEEIKIGETQIYLDDDGGEPPYDGKQWLDLSCTEYEIPTDKFKDGDKVELIIRKKQKGE